MNVLKLLDDSESLFDNFFFTKSFERMPAIERVPNYDLLIVILTNLLYLVRQIEFRPAADRRLRVAAERRGSVYPAGRFGQLLLLLVTGWQSLAQVHLLLVLLVVVLLQRILPVAARVRVPTTLVVAIIWVRIGDRERF